MFHCFYHLFEYIGESFLFSFNLILVVSRFLVSYKKYLKSNEKFCLRQHKINDKMVLIRLMLHLNFVQLNVLLKVKWPFVSTIYGKKMNYEE